jgi:hypothetical protein
MLPKNKALIDFSKHKANSNSEESEEQEDESDLEESMDNVSNYSEESNVIKASHQKKKS